MNVKFFKYNILILLLVGVSVCAQLCDEVNSFVQKNLAISIFNEINLYAINSYFKLNKIEALSTLKCYLDDAVSLTSLSNVVKTKGDLATIIDDLKTYKDEIKKLNAMALYKAELTNNLFTYIRTGAEETSLVLKNILSMFKEPKVSPVNDLFPNYDDFIKKYNKTKPKTFNGLKNLLLVNKYITTNKGQQFYDLLQIYNQLALLQNELIKMNTKSRFDILANRKRSQQIKAIQEILVLLDKEDVRFKNLYQLYNQLPQEKFEKIILNQDKGLAIFAAVSFTLKTIFEDLLKKIEALQSGKK